MITWRDMTAEQRKQHKYETRRARKLFERAALWSKKGTTFAQRRRRSRLVRWAPRPAQPHVEQHNGQQERDRRVRQIARGQLREQNGLARV